MRRLKRILGILFAWTMLYACFQQISVYEVQGNSMYPELLPGEYVVCIPQNTLEIGDIVVADSALGVIIKRVAGFAPSVCVEDEQYTVPNNHVFLLGDNLEESMDSRDEVIGPVPLANIRCVVICKANKILIRLLQIFNIG